MATKNRLTRAVEFKVAAWLLENRDLAQTLSPAELAVRAAVEFAVTVNRNNMITLLRDLGIERVQPRTDADRIADLEQRVAALEGLAPIAHLLKNPGPS